MNPVSSAAGDRFNFMWFLDSDGFPIGKTKTRPVAGGSVNGGPIRLQMPKSATPTARLQPNITVVTGEDGSIQHRYPFDPDNTQLTTITLAAQDLATAGLVQNMPVQSFAGGRYSYLGIANVQIPDVALLFQSRSIRVSDGAQLWSGLLHMRASLTYQGRDGFNERGGANYTYSFTPQPTGYEPWGYTIFDSDGVAKQADTIPFDNFPYPVTIQAFTGDGSTVTFGLDYQPVDTNSIAAILSSQASGTRASVAGVVSAVQNTNPYGFTMAPAPTPTGRRGVTFYQFKG